MEEQLNPSIDEVVKTFLNNPKIMKSEKIDNGNWDQTTKSHSQSNIEVPIKD